MLDRQKIAQWLRGELYRDHKGGLVSRFVCRHLAAGKIGAEIVSLDVPNPVEEGWIQSATGELDTAVASDAQGLGGTQTYCLLTLRGEGEKERSTSRKTFRYHCEESDEEGSEAVSEGPNKVGLVGQLMRHNEALARMLTVAVSNAATQNHRTIEALSRENDQMRAKHLESFALLEELAGRKQERDLEARRAENHQKIMQDAYEKATLLLPAVVNKFAGSKILPESTTPEREVIKSVLGSFKSEQWDAILAVCTPEQKIALGTMIDSLQAGEKG